MLKFLQGFHLKSDVDISTNVMWDCILARRLNINVIGALISPIRSSIS